MLREGGGQLKEGNVDNKTLDPQKFDHISLTGTCGRVLNPATEGRSGLEGGTGLTGF